KAPRRQSGGDRGSRGQQLSVVDDAWLTIFAVQVNMSPARIAMRKELQDAVQRREVWGFEEREPLVVACGVPSSLSRQSDPRRSRFSPAVEVICSPFERLDEIHRCL